MNEHKLKDMTVEFCNKKRFNIKPSIVYQSKELDTVVLQIDAASRNIPPPFTKFATVDPEKDDGALVHLIAYSEKKQIHFDVELWNPSLTRIQNLKEFCAYKYKIVENYDNDYDELLHKNRLVVKCQFEHGASGCPGLMLTHNNNEPHVVLMFARGFPNFYYRRSFARERRKFPRSKLFQQGISLCSIYNDMKKKNPQLCEQIFEYVTYCKAVPTTQIKGENSHEEMKIHATEPDVDDISSGFIPANIETIQKILCKLHKEHMSFFCCSHESIICVECVCSNHIKCPDILTVTRAAKYGLSSLIDSTEQKLDGLNKNVDFLMQKQITILKKIDKQWCCTMRGIIENRTSHFDIETETEKDLKGKRSHCFNHVKNITRELNEIKQKIDFISQDLQNKKSIEKHDQAFCHLHDIKLELESIEKRLNHIQCQVFQFNWISEFKKNREYV